MGKQHIIARVEFCHELNGAEFNYKSYEEHRSKQTFCSGNK